MTKIVRSAVVVLGLLLAASAFAGVRYDSPVAIYPSSKWAGGSLGSTRNSADGISALHCSVQTGTSSSYGWCWARDAAGTYATCSTSNPALLDTMKGLKGDSYVVFYWDDSGACTSVYTYNGSQPPPKNP